nr:glycosyltransferase family 39 protein [Kineococcus siccus]
MQPWAALAGSSATALRVPSALAAGAAATGVVVLARRLGSRRYAVTAGLVLVLLPRVTSMGAEARSTALVTALVTWWVVALVTALRRGGRCWWVLTGALGVAATLVFVYAGLLVLAQAVSLVVARRGPPPRGWWPGALAVLATTAALGAVAAGQAGQVSWLPEVTPSTLWLLAVDQFFPGSRPLALLAWTLVLVGVAGTLRRARRDRPAPRDVPGPVALALPWLVLPPALLVGASLLGDPLYYPRYVAFTSGALALLVALPLARWRRGWRPAAALGVLAAVAAPTVAAQRQVTAKSDYALVAAEVQRQSQPGDVVLWGPLAEFPADTRVVAAAYPEAFAGLQDPTRGAPRSAGGGLWPATRPLTEVVDGLARADDVLVVRDAARPLLPGEADRRLLAEAGFAPAGTWHGPQTDVLRFERVDAG